MMKKNKILSTFHPLLMDDCLNIVTNIWKDINRKTYDVLFYYKTDMN